MIANIVLINSLFNLFLNESYIKTDSDLGGMKPLILNSKLRSVAE